MKLLATIQEVKDNTAIDNNVDNKVIESAIRDSQDTIIEQVLGTELYNTLINSSNLTGKYVELLEQYVKRTLYASVNLYIIDSLVYKYRAAGLIQTSGNTFQQASFNDMAGLKKNKERLLSHHTSRLQSYLDANKASFAELSQDTDYIEPEKGAIMDFGIFTDDEGDVW